MGSKTSRLAGDNPNQTTFPPATHQHDQSIDSFNNSSTNSSTHNSTSTSTHNSSLQTTTTTNSIIIDEEMYQQLINHANLNAPAHLLPPQRVTYSKIKNCVLFEDIHNDEYIMERYSMCLSDPKSMLETYLNLDNTITKQWDEKVRMLESEMNSNEEENHHEEKTDHASSSELSNNSSSNSTGSGDVNNNNNTGKKKKNAKNMHLFSPQFYEIIASAKATTEKTLDDTERKENLLESERQELEEVKYALSFDVGLSQMDFEIGSANGIQENVAKVFEGLSNNVPSSETIDESSNQINKKEVKWSDEILDLANSNNNTPLKKPSSVSNTPNLHHTPITALTTSIAMDQVLMTPPQFTNSTPSQLNQTSTPGSNLTRSSAVADIPTSDLTLSHHGIEGNSTNIAASMTSAGLSGSFTGSTSNNTHGSFTENLSEDNLKDWWRSNPTLEKSIKIKLIVTDMHHHNKTKQTIRQIVSPLLSPVKILPAFGMFHTALVISEFKLEWTDSSLCIPRKLSSQSSFFSADIEEITTAHDLEDIVKKLSEVICRWNTTMIYSERKRKKKSKKPKKSSKSLKNYVNTGNCQDFIFDILDSIGKKEVLENLISSDSPMGQYMRDMRKYGRCAMEFKMNHAFREKFSIKEKVKKFLTHAELDLFVKQLETKDPDFKHNHKNEWILLKGFDRAFWIRHLAYKDNPDMKPLYEKQENVFDMTDIDMSDSTMGCCEILACPFDDPQKTMSIILKN